MENNLKEEQLEITVVMQDGVAVGGVARGVYSVVSSDATLASLIPQRQGVCKFIVPANPGNLFSATKMGRVSAKCKANAAKAWEAEIESTKSNLQLDLDAEELV